MLASSKDWKRIQNPHKIFCGLGKTEKEFKLHTAYFVAQEKIKTLQLAGQARDFQVWVQVQKLSPSSRILVYLVGPKYLTWATQKWTCSTPKKNSPFRIVAIHIPYIFRFIDLNLWACGLVIKSSWSVCRSLLHGFKSGRGLKLCAATRLLYIAGLSNRFFFQQNSTVVICADKVQFFLKPAIGDLAMVTKFLILGFEMIDLETQYQITQHEIIGNNKSLSNLQII